MLELPELAGPRVDFAAELRATRTALLHGWRARRGPGLPVP